MLTVEGVEEDEENLAHAGHAGTQFGQLAVSVGDGVLWEGREGTCQRRQRRFLNQSRKPSELTLAKCCIGKRDPV